MTSPSFSSASKTGSESLLFSSAAPEALIVSISLCSKAYYTYALLKMNELVSFFNFFRSKT